MNRKPWLTNVYYALAAVGLLTTWYFNGRYLLEGGGLGPEAFFGAAFANALTTAITLDVYLSAIVFAVWVITDGRRNQIRGAIWYVLACFGIGLAIALPLYLAAREKALVQHAGV